MKVSKKIAWLAAGVFWFSAAPIAVAADDAATIRANTEAWFKAFNEGNRRDEVGRRVAGPRHL